MIWNKFSFLTQEECNAIISSDLPLKDAEVSYGFDSQLRLTQICFVAHPLPDLNQRVLAELERVQVSGYQPSGFGNWQFGKYSTGCFYDWHQDAGKGFESRYYSVVIELGGEYTGGELEIESQGESHVWTPSVGNLILFPSVTRHRVRKVESGTRYSLVNWISLVRTEEPVSLL